MEAKEWMQWFKNLVPAGKVQQTSNFIIDHATIDLVSGFGFGFGSDADVATPLSATASKNRSMTVLPRRRFASEICSFGKCA